MDEPITTATAPNRARGAWCNSRLRSGSQRFPNRHVAVRLFVTCWLVYALHFATNTVREMYPALTLGDHLSFDVSEYRELHPFDIFTIPGRGAFINNNPGASILGAIPYGLTRPIINQIVERVLEVRQAAGTSLGEYKTIYPLAQEFYRKAREKGLDVKFGLAAAVIQSLLMAPLSAISVVLMYQIFLSLKLSARSALFLSLLYAFATPVFYRTAQLNQNLLVSHFAFFAFALLWKPWDALSKSQDRWLFLAGLLAGWTVVLDYSGLVVVLTLGIYLLVSEKTLRLGRKSIGNVVRYASGAGLAISVLLAYQWISFGHPFYPAQSYMPPANYTHLGYRGMDWPRFDLLWETAFNIRYGLFVSAPILLLSLYLPGWAKGHRLLDTAELYFVLLFITLFFLFCSANQYGRMQFNTGVRHIVPVTPFLFFLTAGVLLRMPTIVAALTALVTVYWSWCLAMYRDVEQGLGVMESMIRVTFEGFRLPWLTAVKNMGYFSEGTSIGPLFLILGTVLWIIWYLPVKTSMTEVSIQPSKKRVAGS